MPDDNQQLEFVHLHVHTEFSLLDGLCKVDKLVKHAKSLGMRAVAITDHGAMHGVVSFFRACTSNDIKPIIGMEGYLAKKDRHTHDPSERQPFHLLLLAKDMTGYKNLLKIASTAHLEGFYNRPRIDKEYLAAHAEGLICTSGCLAAEIPRMIMDGRDDEARHTIGWYQEVFGKDNFFLELQSHDIEELFTVNKWLVENRDFARVPLLATNDVHYIHKADAEPHDTLLCIQTNAKKADAKRMRMTDPSYYLRTTQEMWEIFQEVPEAIHNTLMVAEMCNVDLTTKGYHLPVFPVPAGYNAETYLRALAERGLRWRYGELADTPLYRERLAYELSVIHKMGFDTYFLIVWDLCQFARHTDIWWNVRGSGAGSVTAFSLGITNIDPIHNNLIFERFLNPGRVSMPDIDMDFPDDRRAEMIDYAMRKYGSEKVAAIITFGTLKARAAIKDVGRALDFPLSTVNELTSHVPQIPSRPVSLTDCLGDDPEKAVPELKERYNSDPTIKNLLDNAILVEGISRNAGTHAAGVIIGDAPLVEYLPLHRPIGDTRLTQVTQFPMEICESIGLLKVDFLGLSTLTIMRKACELIEKYHGLRFDMSNIPYRPEAGVAPDDPGHPDKVRKLFELIGNGETTGVFQLESGGMKRMLVEMKPQTFEHIIAAISLYRPGPLELIPTYIARMHGKENVVYHHPKLEPVLKETYGICISGDSVVADATTGQRLRIDQLADRVPGFMIQGIDADHQPAIGRVTHWFDNGIQPVYRLTLADGASIKATASHQFLTESGWRQLRDLRAGDYICEIPETIPLPQTLTRIRVTWSEIATIEAAGEERVYDLTVEGLHNFVANNIIVHNCVYQEQIQQIAAQLFGYSLGDADLMRRAVSKKKAKDLMTHKEIFKQRGPENEVSVEVAEKIFSDIEYFAAYGFNKCLTGDTRIIDTSTGRLHRIADIAAKSVVVKRTLALNPDSKQLKPTRLTAIHNNGVKPVYRLITRDGREIDATDTHQFLTPAGWAVLGTLRPGDEIAMPRLIPAHGTVTLPDEAIAQWASDLGNMDTPCLPNELFALTNAQIALLLAKMWDRQGHLNTPASQASYTTRSKQMALEVKHLLLRLGIASYIAFEVSGVADNLRGHHVVVYELGKFWDAIGKHMQFVPKDFTSAVELWRAGAATFKTDPAEFIWGTVHSIQYIGEQPTYDLTAPEFSNFVANDLIVHNSHAADYAVLTCQTAYLKAHYPEEYYTALLSVQRDNIADVALFTADCRKFGIPILPPDVNFSDLDFTIEAMPDRLVKGRPVRGIRYGLSAIKNAGEKALSLVIHAREAGGRFRDLSDFCNRADLNLLGKKALESLAKVGAFDTLAERDDILASLERMIKYSSTLHNAKAVGQASMFDASPTATDALELAKATSRSDSRERMKWEKELIGLSVSPHPMESLIPLLQGRQNFHFVYMLRSDDEDTPLNGRAVVVAGMLAASKVMVTKKGDEMGVITIEDNTGRIDAVLFPRTWKRFSEMIQAMIQAERLVLVYGKADTSRGDPQIIVDSVSGEFDHVQAADNAQEWTPPVSDYSPPEPPTDDDMAPPPDPMFDLPTRKAPAKPLTPALLSSPPPSVLPTPTSAASTDASNGTGNRHQGNGQNGYGNGAARNGDYAPKDAHALDIKALDAMFDDDDAPSARALPRLITITFLRTDDTGKDRRRINHISHELRSYPGSDRFRFKIIDAEKTIYWMPDYTTEYNPQVEAFLIRTCGEGEFTIEDFVDDSA